MENNFEGEQTQSSCWIADQTLGSQAVVLLAFSPTSESWALRGRAVTAPESAPGGPCSHAGAGPAAREQLGSRGQQAPSCGSLVLCQGRAFSSLPPPLPTYLTGPRARPLAASPELRPGQRGERAGGRAHGNVSGGGWGGDAQPHLRGEGRGRVRPFQQRRRGQRGYAHVCCPSVKALLACGVEEEGSSWLMFS